LAAVTSGTRRFKGTLPRTKYKEIRTKYITKYKVLRNKQMQQMHRGQVPQSA
jgi:hypothetical protein